jgi:hypothetical protein
MTLTLKPNVTAPDDIYEAIIAMHEGLTDDESTKANARLILILANHIGDAAVIRKATKAARGVDH